MQVQSRLPTMENRASDEPATTAPASVVHRMATEAERQRPKPRVDGQDGIGAVEFRWNPAGAALELRLDAARARQSVLGQQHYRRTRHSGRCSGHRAVVLAVDRRFRVAFCVRLAASEERLAGPAGAVENHAGCWPPPASRSSTPWLISGLPVPPRLNVLLMQSSLPLIVTVWAFVLFKERPSGWQLVAIMVSLAGVAFVAAHGSLDALLALRFYRADVWIMASVDHLRQLCGSVAAAARRASTEFHAGRHGSGCPAWWRHYMCVN